MKKKTPARDPKAPKPLPIDDPNSLVMDPRVVAPRLGLSMASTYKGMEKGEIPCIKVGRRRLIPRRQFEAWINGKPLAIQTKDHAGE